MRAVIDIGTNSALLLVGRRNTHGYVEVSHEEARVTRLGQGVAGTGRLAEEAIVRTLAVLGEYRATADHYGAELIAVATEGLRMASNRDHFLVQAREVLGTHVRLISGDEEARLSYLSVAQEVPNEDLRVLDIGGGSTELVVGRGQLLLSAKSHRIGSVRLTEQFLASDPPLPVQLSMLDDTVRAAFSTQPLSPAPILYGLAGTVTTVAAMLLGLTSYDRDTVDGTRWPREAVFALRDGLAAETTKQRTERPLLSPGRADVIVAGLWILAAALDHCGADTLVARDRGLRYALI